MTGRRIGRHRYVAITGAIAAGASTLTHALIRKLGWEPLLEEAVEVYNPFFMDAYADFPRWGFHSQVDFLTRSAERHLQLVDQLHRPEATQATVIVEDRTPFEHTGAYLVAYQRLHWISDREAQALERLTRVVERHYIVPDLLIFREASLVQLVSRTTRRARPGEQHLDSRVLDEVHRSFSEFIGNWDRSPVLT
ncbi:MAG: deoxynucleoside kinase, partial [Candidatus Dormibacteraceae bacterium]